MLTFELKHLAAVRVQILARVESVRALEGVAEAMLLVGGRLVQLSVRVAVSPAQEAQVRPFLVRRGNEKV